MQEILELAIDYARSMWRFRRYAILTAWVVCLLGWLVVLMLPNKYEATARVFVDPQTSLKPVIKDLAVEQDVNAELNLVRQSLLSDAQLTKVMQAVGLDAKAATIEQKTRVVDALRKRIEVGVSGSGTGEGANQTPSKIYTLTYEDSSRDRSLKVVQILLNNFMEGTLGGKREGSQKAQEFLEQQIKDYEQRLSQAEDRLAEFKKNHVGMVPGDQREDYFTRLQNEMDAVKKSQTALNAAVTRRDALQRQLRGEAPAAFAGGSSVMVPGQPGVQGGGDTLSRIKETQAKLDELLLRFTDKHPDVIATRQTLADLKVRREAELEALRRGDPGAAAATGASNNPVYQNIQLALNQAQVDVATAQAELGDHQQKVTELRRMVDTMPQVEAEYAQLNRDYNVTKAQYTALAERLEKARVGEEADASGSVRFEVIDPPNAPFKPSSPKRPLLLAGVLVAGFAAGLGVAYLLSMFQPVFNNVSSLASVTGLTVLGVVSLSRSDAELAEVKRGYLRYSVLSGLLVAALMMVVIIGRFFAPLGGHA